MSSRPHRSASPAAHRHVAPVHRGPQASAPVHRGPQAMSATTQASPHHAPNAALLIDFDNVTMGIRSELQTELRNLLSSDIVKGKVSVQRAYADWRRYPQYIVPLAESSIDMIMATAYGSAKKNATDIRLAVDAMELVFTRPEIGTFILLSGDSDFASLVTKLKEYGKYVIGVGIRESSSDLLVMNCDEYYSYNALAGLVRSGEEEVVKKDPWELVTEAISQMKRNGDVMRADRLKQVMQQIDSSFDEKNLGMSKFSRFVTEAAHRGLLTLTKLENGQFEVGLPGAARGQSAGSTWQTDLELPVFELGESEQTTVRGLCHKARELGHAEVLLVERTVDLLHHLFESVGAHHVAVALHLSDGFGDELPRVLLHCFLFAAPDQAGERVIAVVLVAVHDEEVARGFADAYSDDVLAVLLELGDEAGKIGIARQENERADLGPSENQLHCVDGETNIRGVLLRGAVRGRHDHVDR